MSFEQEVDQAVGAHGAWKSRLKQAIDSGKIDTPIATIQSNNQCQFGKWLYGSNLPASTKSSPQYQTIAELHTQFHKLAAHVAELAASGKKDKATEAMAPDSEFAKVSSKLVMGLMAWKKSLRQVEVQ